MIHLNHLKKQFGPKIIFGEASAHIPPKTRVGLVGPNGSGKTTLFRMLIGEEQPDDGEIVIAKGARLGYLKQEVWENPDRSILAEVLHGFPELQALEQELIALESEMAHSDEAMLRYGQLRERFDALGGYELDHQAKKILGGLGFKTRQFSEPLRTLSGGWMMRVALARLLLSQPEVLLLDEPTNHLDLRAIEWLEAFLLDYPGTIVLTTHDQIFMQRIAERIVEISLGKLNTYVGDFESYVEEKASRQEQLQAQFKAQQKRIAEVERFVERFRYKATKARQVQSRVKMLEKMKRVAIEKDPARLINFRLPDPPRSGQEVVRLENVGKRYGDNVVYQALSCVMTRGEKIALVGENGAGKSTLLKILAGVLPIDSGTIAYGHNVGVEYYAQHQLENLDPANTIFDELATVTPNLTPQQRRSLLGGFLFSGDDVLKPIAVLSGGEKARVALAKLLGNPANFLIMDEPTNHLDILSRQVLEEALDAYVGTLVFISHDRAFINAIATKIVEVRDGQLHFYLGSYDDYVWHKQQEAREAEAQSTLSVTSISDGRVPTQDRKAQRRARAEMIQKRSQVLKPLTARIGEIETTIAGLEKEKATLLQELCDPAIIGDHKIYLPKLQRQRQVELELEGLLKEWTELNEQVEQAALG